MGDVDILKLLLFLFIIKFRRLYNLDERVYEFIIEYFVLFRYFI